MKLLKKDDEAGEVASSIRPMHIAVLHSKGWLPFSRGRVRLVIDGQERSPVMKVPRNWTLEFYAATSPTPDGVPPIVDALRLSDVVREPPTL